MIDDLIRFWRSKVKVSEGCRGIEGIHVKAGASKSSSSFLFVFAVVGQYLLPLFREFLITSIRGDRKIPGPRLLLVETFQKLHKRHTRTTNDDIFWWNKVTAGSEGDRILTSGLTKGRIECHVVIEDWIILLLRTPQQRLPMLLSGPDHPQTPLPWVSLPHLTRGSLGSRVWVSTSNGIWIGSAVFAEYIRVTNTETDTQTTLRVTSVAIDRICATCMRCGLKIGQHWAKLLYQDSRV